jgi:hypothetical protein
MSIYAAVVGIENYDQLDWPVEGPCANAIAVARWLTSIMPCANIYAFLDSHPSQPLPNEIPGLSEVQVVRSATWTEIDEFFRLKLPANRQPNSRLLVFWSGHACTSKTGNRIFFCRDYQEKLPNRVFNASNFLRALRSTDYRSFSEQIFLADVCGVYNETPISDLSEAPTPQKGVRQLAYFATPEGDYARGPEGRGVFTGVVLSVLHEIGKWPRQEQLVRRLTKAFLKVGETPFRVSSASELQEFPTENLIGSVGISRGSDLFQSVFRLLSDLDVISDVFLPHYLRTVSDLGIPALANAQGLVGILEELSSLRDKDLTKGVPRGLLQLLLRLSQEAVLAQPLGKWLEENAAGQKNTLADIRKKLATETLRKILVVLVDVDERGKIAAFQPFLRNSDFGPVAGRTFAKRAAGSWPAFVGCMQEVLAEFIVEGELENIEIHFLVDPPLFDAPFHRIPLARGGPPVGEQAVVLLRHRRRVLSSNLLLHTDWKNYADALRQAIPKEMTWLRIEPGAALPAKKGPCFAAFVLAPAHEGGPPCENEKQLLSRLLGLGAPYLCWAHALPPGANWDTVENDLTRLLSDINTIDRFPNTFRVERLRGSELASHSSILWDDPFTKPFSELEGVGIR